jgi:endo-1,4-beta-xylanase
MYKLKRRKGVKMINLFSRKLITIIIAAMLLCFSVFTVTAQTICDNQTGTHDGYTYEYWKDQGSGCMTLGSGGTFSVEWSNINNLLARKGLRPGGSDVIVDYGVNYNPNGNSYMCVYGWTQNPLVEYYIVESWGSWRPPGGEGHQGTLSSDGGSYDIYKTMRYDQPSIEGTATFPQFWSVRTSKKTSGTVTCANHFNAWAGRGMNMGNFYEVSFCIEGYQSSGNADVHTMNMYTGSNPTPTPTPVSTQTPVSGTLGDVNDDGSINIVDALLVAQDYVGLYPANFNRDAADTNCDGSVNILDALLIAQYYVGLINSFC